MAVRVRQAAEQGSLRCNQVASQLIRSDRTGSQCAALQDAHLLAATLYIIGAFGPLGPFSPSAGPWLVLDISTLTLVHDTDLTRPIPVFVRDYARAFANAGYRA